MLTVESENFDNLNSKEKDDVPNNGSGKEYASYLRIKLNGISVALYSDAMEPEDAVFFRDLSWVKDAIERAYAVGVDDGKRGE